ncbi:MAG TPA: iron-containing redox enzyme family protein [Kofleriaceae bacterium]|nr:iron-containing redox enzyme family protein [Kofleriaceae bacterium]
MLSAQRPVIVMEDTMRLHAKQETEPIFATLDRYRAELLAHPLLVAARTGQIERTTLLQFAFYQYSDSITWIPMLAQMKSRALRSRRLRAAIEDNIGHEAGIGGISHVTLAAQLMRSLGVRTLAAFPTDGFGRTAQLWLSDDFVEMSEPALAGWLLTAETLVPEMFAVMKPCFDGIADTTYFTHHIAVDSDEHSAWMAEAVDEVVSLYGPACVPLVLEGMADAWQETLEDPDALWRLRCASR